MAARTPVTIQLLDFSDWHAQLDPLNIGRVNIGGAAVLSSYFKADRLANPNTLTFTAGDAFGASPPLSGFFNDEPAIQAMNLMGVSADTLGNHNFDSGLAYLQDLIDMADFPYLRQLEERRGQSGRRRALCDLRGGGSEGGRVAITNPEAPTLVFPGRFGTIEVTDPVPAANKARAMAQMAGPR